MSEIIFNSPVPAASLKDQVDNFQTTLAFLNQQVINLQETLQEKDAEIARLKEAKNTSHEGFPYFFLSSCAIIIILTFVFQINLFSPFWEILLSAFIITAGINYLRNFVQEFFGK